MDNIKKKHLIKKQVYTCTFKIRPPCKDFLTNIFLKFNDTYNFNCVEG